MNAESDGQRGDGGGGDPRLVQVVWSGFTMPAGGILHRLDSDAVCGSEPIPNPSTDLATAAVDSDVRLCKNCEWPDGAQEVLDRAE